MLKRQRLCTTQCVRHHRDTGTQGHRDREAGTGRQGQGQKGANTRAHITISRATAHEAFELTAVRGGCCGRDVERERRSLARGAAGVEGGR